MITFGQLIKDVHKNAKDHGWWDEQRSTSEIYALIHSEISEAVEEFRNGNAIDYVYYREDGKPEGIAVELADVIIRIFDLWGKFDTHTKYNDVMIDRIFDETRWFPKYMDSDDHMFLEFANHLHIHTFVAGARLLDCVELILNHFHIRNIDIMAIILEKHEFNKSRPYKHGKTC